jgi:hypothetical protein
VWLLKKLFRSSTCAMEENAWTMRSKQFLGKYLSVKITLFLIINSLMTIEMKRRIKMEVKRRSHMGSTLRRSIKELLRSRRRSCWLGWEESLRSRRMMTTDSLA